ncbi:MAG TPA: 4'-phosphopantetheinyl transferase superfamily protein [Stellaceae bacterium]|jgi:4'-phosphopantetheinyl transferase
MPDDHPSSSTPNSAAGRHRLAPGEVHVWHLPLDVPQYQLAALRSILAPDEQARAARFVFDRDRDHYTVARGSLRCILARYMEATLGGVRPADLRFAYGRNGKPALASPFDATGITFNLSHSGTRALAAVAGGGSPVGIDIERIDTSRACAGIAGRFFSPAEQATLAAVPEERYALGFFKCWASKEAYIKGRGAGLKIPLDGFDVCPDPDAPARLLRPYAERWIDAAGPGEDDAGAVAVTGDEDAAAAAEWMLHDVAAEPGYAAALATVGMPSRILSFAWPGAAPMPR